MDAAVNLGVGWTTLKPTKKKARNAITRGIRAHKFLGVLDDGCVNMDVESMARCIHGAVPKMVVSRFNDTLVEFLDNLRNTFPDQELVLTRATNELRLLLSLGNKELPVQTFLKCAGRDGLQRCLQGDAEHMMKCVSMLGALDGLDVSELWQECPDEVRQNIGLYMMELASLAQAYSKATQTTPDSVVRQMQQLDARLDGMLQSGLSPHQILGSLVGQATQPTPATAKK